MADFHPRVGGYAHAAAGLVRALSARTDVEQQVWTTVALNGAPELSLPRLTIQRLASRRLRWLGEPFYTEALFVRALRRLPPGTGFDCVLFETAEYPIAGLYAAKRFPQRTAVRVHACSETEWTLYLKSWRARWTTKQFFQRVHTIFFTCPYYMGWVRDHFLDGNTIQAASKRYGIIPNAVHPSLPGAGAAPAPGRVRLLTLGRMNAIGENQKNFARLFHALSWLREKPWFDRLELVVVGDGDQRRPLQQLAAQLEIAPQVRFTGALSHAEVSELQAHSHAAILASTYEGFSMFAIECLAHARPLLFADTGGLRDMVEPGRNGYLFDPLDAGAIAGAITRFMDEMLPNWEQARQNSAALFRARFQPADIARRCVDLIRITRAEALAGIIPVPRGGF